MPDSIAGCPRRRVYAWVFVLLPRMVGSTRQPSPFAAPNSCSPPNFDHSLLFTLPLSLTRATLHYGRPRPGSNPEPPSASTRRPTAPPLPATTHHPLPTPHSLFVSPLFSYSYELLFPQPLYFDNDPHCPPVWGYKPPISLRALCLRAAACPDLVGVANPLLSGICRLFPVSLRSFLHSLPLFSIVCSLFPENTRGWGTRVPASSLRPSETVARMHRGA
jgi:hypothetical protein